MMRIYLFVVSTVFIVLVSCKKSITDPNPPPPVTDSTKPERPDTGYLQKTKTDYSYDQSGTIIGDSNLTIWSYDNQGRVTKKIFNSYSEFDDTTYYSYPSGRKVVRNIYYINDVLTSDLTQTYYLNSSGKPDSLTTHRYYLAVYNGVETPQYTDLIRYYHYNSDGNEILEQEYSMNNLINETSRARFTYKGTDLDSAIYGNSINIYENGNVINEIGFGAAGILYSTATFTYYDILSGGYIGIFDGLPNRQLTKSLEINFPTIPANNFIQIYTYAYDKSNRVKTLTATRNNVVSSRTEYTYY